MEWVGWTIGGAGVLLAAYGLWWTRRRRPKLILECPTRPGYTKNGAGASFERVNPTLRIQNVGKGHARNWSLELRTRPKTRSRIGNLGQMAPPLPDGRYSINWMAAGESDVIPPGQFRDLTKFEVAVFPDDDPVTGEYELRADGTKPRTAGFRAGFHDPDSPYIEID